MIRPITLPFGYKFEGGKVVKDEKAIDAKLPVNKRIAKRKSKKVRVVKKGSK